MNILILFVHKTCAVEIVGDNKKGVYEIKILDGLHNGTQVSNITLEQLDPCAYSLGMMIRGMVGTQNAMDIKDEKEFCDVQTLQYTYEFLLSMKDVIDQHRHMTSKLEKLSDLINNCEEVIKHGDSF